MNSRQLVPGALPWSVARRLDAQPTTPADVRLCPSEHKWPDCFSAATAKVLDSAGIPNFLWGDLLYAWRGSPLIANVCGFVVATKDLHRATRAIVDSGLPECTCDHTKHTVMSPGLSYPVHFAVPQLTGDVILYLCPNGLLLDLIPLTPNHRNLAALQYDRIALPLRQFGKVDLDNPSSEDVHVVNVLTRDSLLKVWMLLDVLSTQERNGILYPHAYLLHILALGTSREERCKFASSSLQALWERTYIGRDCASETYDKLHAQVRLEWQTRLQLERRVQ